MSDRERVADELRRIRDGVRERALLDREREGAASLPPLEARVKPAPSHEPPPPAGPPPPRPDNAAVNALWDIPRRPARRGLRGLLEGWLRRLLAPALEAQVAFNSRQVQLDNEVLDYIDERFHHTHRHYDQILGTQGRRIEEADERHLILQEELVAHVHDLVKRIDLVLSEAERGRLGLEFALRDIRARVQRLEERLLRG